MIFSQTKSLKIATWNIEHLGSSGRGFPECKKDLKPRTENEFQKIAQFIKDELQLDIVAVQEVCITGKENNQSRSEQLDAIVKELGTDWKYYLANVNKEDFGFDMQNAFIYNSKKVDLSKSSEMEVPKFKVGEKPLFDRAPLVGYFEIKNEKVRNKGF